MSRISRIAVRLVVSTAARARSAVAVSPAAIAIRAVLDCTATALSPWPTRSWRSRAIRSLSSTVARRPASSMRERSLRTSTPSRATTAVTAATSTRPPERGWTSCATATTAMVPAATVAHSRDDRRRSGPVVARVQITTQGAQGATMPSTSARPA